MAILTSKGAIAPHQLKGRRNVRISRDRRGCGNDDIEQLKDEVNKALADCQKKYYIEGLKDANLATSSGIINSYRVEHDCANIPVARTGVLTVYGYVSGQYSRTTQEYVTNDDSVTTGEKYIRYGMSNDSGTSWTWSDWQKLVTENELNNIKETKIEDITQTLFSLCSSLSAGTEKTVYNNDENLSDIPVKVKGFCKIFKNLHNNRCVQVYYCAGNTDNSVYSRYIEWNGTNWVVQIPWKKMTN